MGRKWKHMSWRNASALRVRNEFLFQQRILSGFIAARNGWWLVFCRFLVSSYRSSSMMRLPSSWSSKVVSANNPLAIACYGGSFLAPAEALASVRLRFLDTLWLRHHGRRLRMLRGVARGRTGRSASDRVGGSFGSDKPGTRSKQLIPQKKRPTKKSRHE